MLQRGLSRVGASFLWAMLTLHAPEFATTSPKIEGPVAMTTLPDFVTSACACWQVKDLESGMA
jgi:hypothetical protein